MTDTAEECLNALIALSKNPELESLRNGLLEKISNDDLKVVIKRLLLVTTSYTASNTSMVEPSLGPSRSAAPDPTPPSSLPRNGRRGRSNTTKSNFLQAYFKVPR
jgi:hypothetical protein